MPYTHVLYCTVLYSTVLQLKYNCKVIHRCREMVKHKSAIWFIVRIKTCLIVQRGGSS